MYVYRTESKIEFNEPDREAKAFNTTLNNNT